MAGAAGPAPALQAAVQRLLAARVHRAARHRARSAAGGRALRPTSHEPRLTPAAPAPWHPPAGDAQLAPAAPSSPRSIAYSTPGMSR
jgi:hypothetical protein